MFKILTRANISQKITSNKPSTRTKEIVGTHLIICTQQEKGKYTLLTVHHYILEVIKATECNKFLSQPVK
jgi:hypothetical protein